MYSDTDKYYSPKEMADMLGLEPVTLRKYSIALEKAGYIFLRNDSDRRLYSERDAMALQHLKALRERNALNVDNAAMAVATRFSQVNESVETVTHSQNLPAKSVHERSDERYEVLEAKLDEQTEQIAKLTDMMQALVERLDERDNVIRELSEALNATKAIAAASEERQSVLSEREKERDEKLTQLLRDMTEVKASTNRSVWSRLFGK